MRIFFSAAILLNELRRPAAVNRVHRSTEANDYNKEAKFNTNVKRRVVDDDICSIFVCRSDVCILEKMKKEWVINYYNN